MSERPDPPRPRVAILADDLIWATRLASGVRGAGGQPVPVRATGALAEVLPTVAGCVIDLTARAYQGIAAIEVAARAGVPVVAVGQHDDTPLRRAARAAGADHVFAYRALFEHTERTLGAWVEALAGVAPAVDGR